MQTNSLVSIIVPTFNRVHLLRQTLLSCLLQTYGNIEILVVDDGSDEDIESAAYGVCRNETDRKKISIYRQRHAGGSAARNLGIQESEGDYIQFLDSDDLMHPQKLEMQVHILNNRTDLDMVYGLDLYFRDIPGDMSEVWNMPNELDDLDRFLADDGVWHTASPLWRRTAVKNNCAWNSSIVCWQDWEYHILAICRGIKYAHVPMALQFIRDHDGPRITNIENVIEREESKMQAGAAVLECLSTHGLLTKKRGNLLALYFIEVGIGLKIHGRNDLSARAMKLAGSSASALFKALVALTELSCFVDEERTLRYFHRARQGLLRLTGSTTGTWKSIKLNDVHVPESFLATLQQAATR
jgi:glycosyltransferase involved in cell wall biosynthesis